MEKCDGKDCPWTATCRKFTEDGEKAPFKDGICKEYEPKSQKDFIKERKKALKD